MTHAEKAAEHVSQAEEVLAKSDKGTAERAIQKASQATAHATLALYHQREAEKQG
jgi:hypothetical protein